VQPRENGRLRTGTLKDAHVFDGIPCSSSATTRFYENGTLSDATLAVKHVLVGETFEAGTEVYLAEDGTVDGVMLPHSKVVKSVPCEKHRWVKFYPSGALKQATLSKKFTPDCATSWHRTGQRDAAAPSPSYEKISGWRRQRSRHDQCLPLLAARKGENIMDSRWMIPGLLLVLVSCSKDEDCSVDTFAGVGGRPCEGCYPACPEGFYCHVGYVPSYCDTGWGDIGVCMESGRDGCNPFGGDGCNDVDTTCLQEHVGNCMDLDGLCVTAEERENILSGPVAGNFRP